MKNLTSEEIVLYNTLTKQILENLSGAWSYAKKNCNDCRGKGHFERTFVLPKGNPFKSTPPETELCHCVKRELLNNVTV